MTKDELLTEEELIFLIETLRDKYDNINENLEQLSLMLENPDNAKGKLSPKKIAFIKIMKKSTPDAYNSTIKEFMSFVQEHDGKELQQLSNVITKLSLQKSLL